MNSIEKRMLEVLRDLKQNYGVLAIKAEFEAEGSRKDELVKLNEIVFRADMDLIIKIGGCEAVRDLDQCKLLGATGIMAPMIETPFAMKKFVCAAQKVYGEEFENIEWIVNTETKTCRENLDEILEEGKGFLNTIAIGRVDLSASMGLTRADINSEIMLKAAKDFAMRAKNKGLKVGFGGGISFEAIPFIQQMSGLADKFETRKVVFSYTEDKEQLQQGILRAMEFEQLYLQNKCDLYDRMASEDKTRLKMLRDRIAVAEETIKK